MRILRRRNRHVLPRFCCRVYYFVFLLLRHIAVGLRIGYALGRKDTSHNRKYRELQSRVKDIDWSRVEYLKKEKIHGSK
jgi:hypothetical protein